MDSSFNMELSIFIARILGIMYLSVGIGFFLFREPYVLALRKILDNPGYALLGGFMAIVGGMAMVTYHNLWVSDWRVIITIIGWIALIKGVILLLSPSYLQLFRPMLLVRNGKAMTIAILLLGILFTYLGFVQ
ncbi:hypothetical protein [Ekhidna sp.]|uniref:hypothetical protein n=1 Tax=Ekhidna sp. TaxID=2608089 RepID=UPI003BAB5CBE